jgi:hypothetical protein
MMVTRSGALASRILALLVTIVAVGSVVSCGSEGDSNGFLCQPCSDSDLPCQESIEVSGDKRPGFCGEADPCAVLLYCNHRFDSAAQRCYPANPADGALDDFYRCDGDRPDPNG